MDLKLVFFRQFLRQFIRSAVVKFNSGATVGADQVVVSAGSRHKTLRWIGHVKRANQSQPHQNFHRPVNGGPAELGIDFLAFGQNLIVVEMLRVGLQHFNHCLAGPG